MTVDFFEVNNSTQCTVKCFLSSHAASSGNVRELGPFFEG